QALPTASFSRIPSGQGASVTYGNYDPVIGLPPGEVAILFLAGVQGSPPQCPVVPAMGDAQVTGTGVGNSFRITSDVPVVAYQINPYGGGSTAVTGSSLLLPVSVWDTNYIAANAYNVGAQPPSMNIIASQDNTTVTMVPVAAVSGGGGLPSGAQNQPMAFTIHKGQHAQFTQLAPLTGSVISADKPVGFMAGAPCMNIPAKNVFYCDHGEQMLPPVQALGSEYVGVMHRPRISEPAIWRLIGAVDGTQLTWSSDVGGPQTLNQGQSIEFETGTPFVVKAQDGDHPFILFTHMAGATWSKLPIEGYGDPESVISVPPQQYMSRYVFFTDPTIPETNLVIVRSKNPDNSFSDVTLDCLGVLSGWQPVGDYEWTRTDLSTGDFQSVGNCGNGRHEMSSDGRFGLWIWGWGSPETSTFTKRVSYGYPGGMNVQPINKVVIPPDPK
ncbi:MAG: IgGFc-binding protein, partial [Polyangiaceae bacterium]